MSIPRIEDDETIREALKERHADDVYLLDCPYCGVPSYYNQGSHFTCRLCDRTMYVSSDDEEPRKAPLAEDAYSLADYWETAPYPFDERPRDRAPGTGGSER
jgi:hypothetical protein